MAISATASVLTGTGWMYAKDIIPGDWVFNRLGQPVKVKTTQTFRAEECYRVTFDDWLITEGDQNLAFPSENWQERKRAFQYKGFHKKRGQPSIRTVKEFLTTGIYHRGTRKFFSVPTTEPIQLPTQPLGIPPFVYGFWFTARNARRQMNAPLEFSDEIFEEFKNSGYKIEKLGVERGRYEKFRTSPSIWSQLAGESTFTIPEKYLNGSAEQRMQLIKGILMASPPKKGDTASISSFKARKKRISLAVQWLAESLGCKARLSYDKTADSHDLKIHRLNPFIGTSKRVAHLARRYVISIEPIPAQLCTHIETDEENSSFLVGEGFIPCH